MFRNKFFLCFWIISFQHTCNSDHSLILVPLSLLSFPLECYSSMLDLGLYLPWILISLLNFNFYNFISRIQGYFHFFLSLFLNFISRFKIIFSSNFYIILLLLVDVFISQSHKLQVLLSFICYITMNNQLYILLESNSYWLVFSWNTTHVCKVMSLLILLLCQMTQLYHQHETIF